MVVEPDKQFSSWEDFRESRFLKTDKSQKQMENRLQGKKQMKNRKTQSDTEYAGRPKWIALDPTTSMFDRRDRSRKGPQSPSLRDVAAEFPEVKEYMRWRLRRNKNRLAKLDHAALSIQGAVRCMIAKSALFR